MRSRRRAIAVAGAVLFGAVAVVVVVVVVTDRRSSNEYAQFSRCPLDDAATNLCLSTRVDGGRLIIGSTTVPIDRVVTLQGGVHVVENRKREVVRDELIAARGATTLSKTPEAVPGGLAEMVDAKLLPAGARQAFDRHVSSGDTSATATIELAGPPSALRIDIQNLIEAEGVALVLPAKVRLSNGFLGADCHIGSDAHPILLALTTGATHPPKPNMPIRGRVGKATFSDEYNLTVIRGSSLVDNSFAVPAATGCGEIASRSVDRAVNARLGLPAAAGRNTVILDGALWDANAPAVTAAQRR
ncbi:MAG: hypothetical protein ACLQQB_12185 [Solirubrobacteraceae bacterium]